MEFVIFAVRIMTDQNALKDYYVYTDAGKQEIKKIKDGMMAAGKTDHLNKFKEVSDEKTASTDVVDMIAQTHGYNRNERHGT